MNDKTGLHQRARQIARGRLTSMAGSPASLQMAFNAMADDVADAIADDLGSTVRRIADGLEAALDDDHTDRQYAAERALDALRVVLA